MTFTNHMKNVWKNPSNNSNHKGNLIKWRQGLSVVKVDKPTKITRARSLGYKAKKGYLAARVRLLRGGRQRPLIKKGRRSKNRRRLLIVSKNYQQIAEERAAKKFKNCEVLNSYFLAKDGKYSWYEVILLDREIGKNYSKAKSISKDKGRVFRGKTSAGKKARGLNKKGKGTEKVRPSQKSNLRRAH